MLFTCTYYLQSFIKIGAVPVVQGIASQTDKVSAESFNRRVKTETSLRLVWAPPGARYLNLDSWTTTYRKLLCTQNTPNNHWVLTAHRYLRILQVACTNLTCWLYACNTNMDPLYWTIHHPLTSLRTQICFEWKINKWGGCCGSESHWSLIVPQRCLMSAPPHRSSNSMFTLSITSMQWRHDLSA